jgi:hypothetical protein
MFDYDVDMNGYFHSGGMVGAPFNTQVAYARDMASFFTFLWRGRGGRGWRDAEEEDHLAYFRWRRGGECRPRVAGSTWSREVTAVSQFYAWAVARGLAAVNPVPRRSRRAPLPGAVGSTATAAPATLPHDVRREQIEWPTPPAYRRRRDVGVRGYRPDGLADPAFRGRWAARKSLGKTPTFHQPGY